MRKIYLLCCVLLCTVAAKSQVTGTKTIGVDYPTSAAAITDLNAVGVGAGGATINVNAGYTETAPAGGLLLGSTILNASLTASNTLVIQKSGAGASPLITAPAGTSTTVDGIFKLAGVDYVTIDGIDLKESAANATAATAMEWGYAFVNLNGAAPFDGCNNNIVKNCAITLNRTIATPSVAIYFGHNTATSNTALSITAVTDLSSNNKIYSNTISNTTTGIYMLGFSALTPFTLYDQGNDVGGASPATGNNITNFGGTNYTSIGGITFVNQNNGSVSNNTLNQLANGGVNTIGAHWGIYTFGTNSTFTVNNNNITLGIASINTAYFTYGLYSNAAGTNLTATNNIISQTDPSGSAMPMYGIFFPNGNNLTATGNNITQTQGVSGATNGVYTTALGTLNISTNVIKQTTTAAVTSTFASIYCQPASAGVAETINSNSFNNTNVNTTGTYYLIYSSNSTPNITASGNNIVGSFSKSGAGGTVYGYYNNGGPSSGTATISNNNFSNVSLTGATGFYGTFSNTSTSQVVIINNNTVSNVTTGAATIFGFYHSYGAAGSQFNNNTVSGLTGTSTINGLQVGSTASLGITVSGNSISNLSTTGAATVTGLLYSGGTNGNVFKNKISGLTASNAGAVVNGVTIAAATTALNFYNNLIGDLKAPLTTSATDGVRGINITSTSGTSALSVYYNTVSLNAASSGANFSSSGLFHTFSTTATTAALDLRNNIIVNNSTPNGTGITSAIRRSASTNLNNFAATSNNNLLFAGGACSNKFIYYDGTTGYQTLTTYKAFVTPRDALAVSEDPNFLSTSGVTATFLHINPAIATQVESGAATIATYLDDYDGDVRTGTPDIGADEFTGTAAIACTGTPVAGTISPASPTICSGQSTTICLSGQSAAAGITVQWQSATVSGGPYTPIPCASGNCISTGALTAGTYYYVAVITCAGSGLTATTAQAQVVVNGLPSVTVNPAAPTICAGSGINLTASGAVTYTWTPATGLSGTATAIVTASPTVSTTYIVTGSDAIGCSNTATAVVTVSASPTVTAGASATTICSGTSVNLTSAATLPPLLSEGFEGGAIPAGWVSINGGTGNLWTVPGVLNGTARTGTKAAEYLYNSAQAANAYLITSGVNLTGGVAYTVSSWYKSSGATFPEKLKVMVGTAQTVAAQTTLIQDVGTISSATYAQQSATFTPAVTGTYYFAWNAYSAADEFYLDVDDISITNAAATPTYSWTSVPAGFTSNLQNPTGVTPTVTTVYTVTATSPLNGCSTSANVTVTIDPVAYNVTGGGFYCTGGTGLPIGLSNSQTGVNYQLVLNGTTNIGAAVAGTTGTSISFGNQTTAGTYTVVATKTSNSCTNTMTGNAVITLYPVVVVTPTLTQPTTCASTNGAISIALSGAPGPYTFLWTGTGVVPGAQNQTNLTAGNYTVKVTDANGCSTTTAIGLVGPGGCTVCPAIGTVTTNPTPSGCIGSGITLTASGLTSMGVTYGIVFKSFTAATATPYTGGTVLATVPNASLTGGGTVATATGTFAAANNYFIYAILSPTPVDPACTPSAVTTFTINPSPTVIATPASQTICSGGTITTIVLTGTGTTYSWTRDNTAAVTGIAASGSGNISGALTNPTAAPVTVTFTITATTNGCNSTPVTATVLVNPTTVAVPTPASQTICSGGTIVPIALTGVAGTTFTWTRDNSATVPGGIPASGSGSTISGFLTNITNAPITVTFTITPTANGCPGASTTATVVVNPLASAVATPATQTTCSGSAITTIALTGNVTGATYTWTRDNTVNLTGIAASGTGSITGSLVNATNAPITTTFTILPSFAGCAGPAITASVTVNPTPVVTQPANQALCNSANTSAITFASTLAGTTYAWTNNTTSIGLAASGNGNIASFAAVNTGTAAVIATITVTPTSNGCTGTAKTFTITVNPTANVSAVANQTLCTGATTTAITFAGTVTGTTFAWTNNTPSIGLAASGTGNIAAFTAVNATSTAVTATITVTPTAGTCAGTARTFTITVNGQSVAPTGATASNIALCGPGTADLTVQGGALGTGASWKWYSGSCGGTLIGTGATINGVAVSGTATFWVRAEGTCNTTACASVTVTVNAQPTITLSAAPYTSLKFPLTTAITANINPTAAGNTIVWFKDGAVINGAVTNVVSGITVDQLGTYQARVTTAAGCTALSASLVIKDSASDKLFIMSNPNNGQFKLRYYTNNRNFGFLRTVNIYDSKGALVYSKAIPVTGPYSNMDIDIRKAGKGLFLIVLGDDKGESLVDGKVVVQ
jgi:hypothetical protein